MSSDRRRPRVAQTRERGPGRALFRAAAACALLAAAGCDLAGSGRQSAGRSVSLRVELDSVPHREQLLDFRLRHGNLRIGRTDEEAVLLTGTLRAEGPDKSTAAAWLNELRFDITQGRFTRVALPDPPEGIECRVDLEILVPEGIGLRVVHGVGDIDAELDLPSSAGAAVTTDLQLDRGEIALTLPRSVSTFVHAEINVGGDVVIDGFERVSGRPVRQLTHVEFKGSIGQPIGMVGNRLDLRVNTGTIRVRTPAMRSANP